LPLLELDLSEFNVIDVMLSHIVSSLSTLIVSTIVGNMTTISLHLAIWIEKTAHISTKNY